MVYNTLMAKFHLKEKVFALRKEGESIKEIARIYSLSKATVSLWCSDIKLTKLQNKKLHDRMVLAGLKGRLLGAQSNKNKKQKEVKFYEKTGLERIGKLSQRDLLLLCVGLYWAEGSKKDGRFTFTNSDPEMLSLMLLWIKNELKIKGGDISARLTINIDHRLREAEILRFWKSKLHLSGNQFESVSYIKTPHKKIYKNKKQYNGVLAIRIKCGTKYRYHMLGLIQAVKAGVVQW